jgi:hypothetical protein
VKQFECLTRTPGFIREFYKDSRGILIEYDELKELGGEGREPAAIRPGGKWIFKREADGEPKPGQGAPVKPPRPDYDRGR